MGDAILSDGTRIVFRHIRPDDKAQLVEGLRRLSPESVYRRFLSPKPRFTSAELRYLTEVDRIDHVALVALRAGDPGCIVGVARFVRDREDPAQAEAAIVVADPLQGLGLGGAMGLALADEARARGIERFTATMLGTNVAAHRLFARLSRRLRRQVVGGFDEVVAELPLREPSAAPVLSEAA